MSEYDELLAQADKQIELVMNPEEESETIILDKSDPIIRLLTFLETNYSFSGEYPPINLIWEKFPENFKNEAELRFLLTSEDFLLKLMERGLPEYSPDSAPAKSKFELQAQDEYDPLFIAVSNKVLDPGDTRSFAAKIKEFEMLGVKSTTWQAWMKVPKYEAYVTRVLNERFENAGEQFRKMGLLRNMASGDLQSIKYFDEITGRYRPQDQNTQNLTVIIALLMEILAKHVPVGVIDAVSEELESLPIGELSVINSSGS